MTTRKAHVVYCAESFCSLSGSYVYRTAQCLSFIVPMTVGWCYVRHFSGS